MMKTQIYISPYWKKLTAIILLIYFTFSPILFHFSLKECNKACSIPTSKHLSSEMNSEKNSCCDMMENQYTRNILSSQKYEMEFSDISCALVIREKANSVYLTPRTNDNKTEFVPITIIDFAKENLKVELFELKLDFSLRDEPPIYLFNESFLI